jgi:peptidoglycan/xylan/chitin deacetylase (PgdA/CDA1 family)
MPISISRRRAATLLAAAALAPRAAFADDVITRLPAAPKDKVVALTFDACETKTPAFLDRSISDFLTGEKIPFTVFACGRFARHNGDALKQLAALDFVEIENHSMNHDNHMERMADATIRHEVLDTQTMLAGITGHRTKFFRFPAGNYDARSLATVESCNHRVVHWTFASGDPARTLTPAHETEWVLEKTRADDILIFHINGRGWSTGQALPGILAALKSRGYHFARLDALLP